MYYEIATSENDNTFFNFIYFKTALFDVKRMQKLANFMQVGFENLKLIWN